jgi:hypothetical protein
VNPRRSILIGITFVVVSIAYYIAPYLFGGHTDIAGVTMLLALAAAMTVMFYALMAGVAGHE